MQSLGCFGSSLAYNAKSSVCAACPRRDDCFEAVNKRHPILLKLLDRFSDGTGRTMAHAWRRGPQPFKTAPRGRPAKTKPTSATPIDQIAASDPGMGAVVSMLQARPHSMQELATGLTLQCAYSASSAQTLAYRHVSTLTACDRAQRTGPIVELK